MTIFTRLCSVATVVQLLWNENVCCYYDKRNQYQYFVSLCMSAFNGTNVKTAFCGLRSVEIFSQSQLITTIQ